MDELFCCEAKRHHHELEIEPLRLEQEEQVCAEDDRKRKEPECVSVSPRPGQQHVEGIGEEQLRDDQIKRIVYLPPVPPPVREDGRLKARLQIVLRPGPEFQSESSLLSTSGQAQQ